MAEVPAKCCAVCGNLFHKKPSDSRRYWAIRKCCSYSCSVEIRRGRPNPKGSAALKGRQPTFETRQKQSAAMRRAYAEGRVKPNMVNLGLRREQTSQWKGDDITYRTAHARLTNERGRPEVCELCGTAEGWLEWALSHDAEMVKVQVGGTGDGLSYSTNLADYFGTCRSCHREYDGRERDARTGQYL